MSDLNRATMIGNVGGDPDVRTMASGDTMARFSLATSRSWKDKSGEWKSETAWHNVVVFNKFAAKEVLEKVQKGTRLFIEGEVKTREYESDGQKKRITEIVIPNFTGKLMILGRATEESTPPPRAASSSGPVHASQVFDDDIPF